MAHKLRPKSFVIYCRQLHLGLQANAVAPREHDPDKAEIHTNIYGGMLKGHRQTVAQFETLGKKLELPADEFTYPAPAELTPEDQAVAMLSNGRQVSGGLLQDKAW